MGRTPGVKNGQGRKAAAKKTAATPKFNEQTPGAGDNGPPVATAAQIAKAAREIVAQKSVVGTESAILGGLYKKWEDQGVDRERIREAIVDLDLSPEDVLKKQRDRVRYGIATGKIKIADAEWTASVQQGSMELVAASGDIAEELRREAAKQQGFKAGRKGHELDANPYRNAVGSPEFVGWRDGHAEGLKLRKILRPDPKGTERVAARKAPRQQAGREPTQLQKDEAAYRAKGVGLDQMPPATDTPQ